MQYLGKVGDACHNIDAELLKLEPANNRLLKFAVTGWALKKQLAAATGTPPPPPPPDASPADGDAAKHLCNGVATRWSVDDEPDVKYACCCDCYEQS